MAKPTIGRVAIMIGGPAKTNGTDTAPALITRVWGEHPAGAWTVNLAVLPDAVGETRSATSVLLFPDEGLAREYIGENATMVAAFWPPRV